MRNRFSENRFAISVSGLLFVAAMSAVPGVSFAAETKSAAKEELASPVAAQAPEPRDDYCANIANLASDTRYALQMKTLEDLQTEIDKKIAILEAKRAENEAFLKKKNETTMVAQKGLVDIYAKMKPDVAAAQFELLDIGTSVSILRQLNAGKASAILNEMKPPVAAAIALAMARSSKESKVVGGL